MRWHNFVVAVSFGISMTVIGLLLINDPDWAKYYPWTMPGMILNRAVKGIPIMTELLMIGIGSVIIAVIGGWTFTRRDVL